MIQPGVTPYQTALVKCFRYLGSENWGVLCPLSLPPSHSPAQLTLSVEGGSVYCARNTMLRWPYRKSSCGPLTPSRCWSRRDHVLAKPRAYLLPREWVRGPVSLLGSRTVPKQTLLRTPTLQTCSFHWDPALCNQAHFLQGHPALPVPADFPTWESLAAALQLFPCSAVCLSCSRVWVSQIMMCSGFACEILHNSTPIVRLGQAVRPYSVFSLHNVCKSIRRKPEQCDDSGWLDQALGSQAPVTQEACLQFHRNSQF